MSAERIYESVGRSHPCFSEEAHDRVGRVHLPVAPRCNIQCRFCERRVCANLTMQHPGWTRQLLSPEQALDRVRRLVVSHPGQPFVVGVAGPGDPLANPETFSALRLVHREYPHLLRCVSTNGLLLESSLPLLLEAGVSALTVTVNAPDPEVGERIYAWVRQKGKLYRGRQAAEVLIESQFCGLRAALEAGIAVKVNTVLIPGVNDAQLPRLARRLRQAGVRLMNLMPLIPGGQMKDSPPPTCDALRQARAQCESELPQFRRCQHCRADAVHFPHAEAV